MTAIRGVEYSQARKLIVTLSVFWAARMIKTAANNRPTTSPQKTPVPMNTRSVSGAGEVFAIGSDVGSGNDSGRSPVLAPVVSDSFMWRSFSPAPGLMAARWD